MARQNNPFREMDKGNLSSIADIARLAKLGMMMTKIKVVVSSLTAAAAVNITAAATLAAATVTNAQGTTLSLDTGENLPPIGQVVSLRVTASGTAGSLGTYGITDDGGTAIVPPGGAGAAMGIAKLSDDGKTITFPNTVTGFVLEYMPLAQTNMLSLYPPVTG